MHILQRAVLMPLDQNHSMFSCGWFSNQLLTDVEIADNSK